MSMSTHSESSPEYCSFDYAHCELGLDSERETARVLIRMNKKKMLRQEVITEDDEVLGKEQWLEKNTLAIDFSDLEEADLQSTTSKTLSKPKRSTERFGNFSKTDVLLSNRERFKFRVDEILEISQHIKKIQEEMTQDLIKPLLESGDDLSLVRENPSMPLLEATQSLVSSTPSGSFQVIVQHLRDQVSSNPEIVFQDPEQQVILRDSQGIDTSDQSSSLIPNEQVPLPMDPFFDSQGVQMDLEEMLNLIEKSGGDYQGLERDVDGFFARFEGEFGESGQQIMDRLRSVKVDTRAIQGLQEDLNELFPDEPAEDEQLQQFFEGVNKNDRRKKAPLLALVIFAGGLAFLSHQIAKKDNPEMKGLSSVSSSVPTVSQPQPSSSAAVGSQGRVEVVEITSQIPVIPHIVTTPQPMTTPDSISRKEAVEIAIRLYQAVQMEKLNDALDLEIKKFADLIDKNTDLLQQWRDWKARNLQQEAKKSSEIELYSYRIQTLQDFHTSLSILHNHSKRDLESLKSGGGAFSQQKIREFVTQLQQQVNDEPAGKTPDFREEQAYLIKIRKEALEKISRNLMDKRQGEER